MSSRTDLVAALEALADQLPPAPTRLSDRVLAELSDVEAPMCDLDHLHLETSDLARSSAFYDRWFRFRDGTMVGDTLFVHNPYGFLLCLTPAVDVQPLPYGVHFGFTMPSAEAVSQLWRTMRSEGVPADDLHGSDGFASFHCSDPDGRVIEVFWETTQVERGVGV